MVLQGVDRGGVQRLTNWLAGRGSPVRVGRASEFVTPWNKPLVSPCARGAGDFPKVEKFFKLGQPARAWGGRD